MTLMPQEDFHQRIQHHFDVGIMGRAMPRWFFSRQSPAAMLRAKRYWWMEGFPLGRRGRCWSDDDPI